MGARFDEMDAQRVRAPKPSYKSLQKALRPEPGYWIDHWLSPENPACHRKANRRIAQMHDFHKTPPDPAGLPQGRNYNLYRHNSNTSESEQGTSVP